MVVLLFLVLSFFRGADTFAGHLDQKFEIPICRDDRGGYQIEYVIMGSHDELWEKRVFYVLERVFLRGQTQPLYTFIGTGNPEGFAIADHLLNDLSGTFQSSLQKEPQTIHFVRRVNFEREVSYELDVAGAHLPCDQAD
jgi:hypothetical protein